MFCIIYFSPYSTKVTLDFSWQTCFLGGMWALVWPVLPGRAELYREPNKQFPVGCLPHHPPGAGEKSWRTDASWTEYNVSPPPPVFYSQPGQTAGNRWHCDHVTKEDAGFLVMQDVLNCALWLADLKATKGSYFPCFGRTQRPACKVSTGPANRNCVEAAFCLASAYRRRHWRT